MLLSTNYGISWSTFPRQGASEAEQMAAQQDVCEAATSEMDTIANMILRATIDTEDEFGPDWLITTMPNGWVRFRFPSSILAIVSARYCVASAIPPVQWTEIPASSLLTEHTISTPTGTTVPVGATAPTSILIPPGYIDWSAGRKGFRVQATAVTGYPVTGIDVAATAGATSVHVDDITGWVGARGVVYDPPNRESITATAAVPDETDATSGPGTLTLLGPLKFSHTPTVDNASLPDQKILVSTMPQALIRAGLYMTTHFGLIRGATASVMQSARGQVVSSGQGDAQSWYDLAEKSIMRYGRVT